MRSRSISPVSSLESRPDSKLRRWSKPTVTTLKPFHSSSGVSEDSDASDSNDSFQESQDYSTDFTTPSLSRLGGDDQDRDCDDVEAFRDREYPQLKGKVYLDHGGTTLYAKSLIEEVSADLIKNLYGNPHSSSTPSAVAGHRIDAIRVKALRFFNADPEHWDLVFTANATAAIKLVTECLRDNAASTNTPIWYGYHKDAHTSLVGIRELTSMHRCFLSDEEVDTWINSGGMGGPRARQMGLFAYPGQSNMTGRRLPLSWPGRIRKQLHKAKTYTLLDAAALACSAPLSLSDVETAPDFVALSFYKIFGFPDIGALLVQKNSAPALYSRRYFGGGTVDMIISINDTWHAMKDTALYERLEDGTLPFHSIFALDHAMDVHERLYGPKPMHFISRHTAQLGRQLYEGLSNMKHENGLPLAVIYKDQNSVYGDATVQGATIVFNVCRADGSMVGYEEVEKTCDAHGIYVRSGSLCNPGGIATYLGWTPADMRAAYAAGHRCSKPIQNVLGKATGVVRVSLGAMNTAGDVLTLLHFLSKTYAEQDASIPLPETVAIAVPVAGSSQPETAVKVTASSPQSLTGTNDWSSIPSNSKNVPPSVRSSSTSRFSWHPPTTATTSTSSTITERTRAPPFGAASYRNTPNKLRRASRSDLSVLQTSGASKLNERRTDSDAMTTNSGHSSAMRSNGGRVNDKLKRSFGRSVVNLLHRKTGSVAPVGGQMGEVS